MSFRTPMGRARGLGSARDGAGHWWAQRLTAIALVPLTLWFVASVVALAGASHAEVVAWLGAPVPAVLMILMIVATFHHAQLGLQVVIEDYIHHEAVVIISLVLVKLGAFFCAAYTIFAIVRLTFGG